MAKGTVRVGLGVLVVLIAAAGLELRFPLGWPSLGPEAVGPGQGLRSLEPSSRGRSSPRRQAAALCVLLDTSGSMKGEHKLGDALESVSDALGHLGAEDDFGLVAYSNAAGEVLPLGPVSDPAGARSILSGLRAGGATNLSAALRVGEELLQNSTKRRRLLILSDGMPNRGLTSTERLVAESARLYEEGISVSAVGLGVNLNEELLIRMAEAGGGEYTHCRDACCLGAVLALELARARWSDGASRRGP